MKLKSFVFLVILIAISSLFISCQGEITEIQATGTLSVQFEPDVTIKSTTYEPDIGMKVHSYSVIAKGPENRFEGPKTSDGRPVNFDKLYIGDWEIIVTGLNEHNIPIGKGTANVTIESGKKSSALILVEEFSEDGTIEFSVSWPAADIKDPNVKATLAPSSNLLNTITLDLVVNKSLGTATYTGNLPSGNYALQISLYDGSIGNINNKLIGTGSANAVRIVTSATTSVMVTYDADDLKVIGELDITVENRMPENFEVSISSTKTSIYKGDSAKFTATTDIPGEYTYSWYIDGKLQAGVTGNTFIIDENTTIPLGSNNVEVIALKDGVMASDSTKLVVIDTPDNYIHIKIKELVSDEIEYEFMLEYGVDNIFEVMSDPLAISIVAPISARQFVYTSPESDNMTTLIGINKNTPFSFYGSDIPENVTICMMDFPDAIGESISSSYGGPNVNFISSDNIFGFDAVELSSWDDTFHFYIREYDEVGGIIKGSILADRVSLFGYKISLDSEIQIGDFKVEIEFKVKRAEDIVFHQLTFNGNGATGDGPSVGECPKNFNFELSGNNEGNSFIKSGFIFTGWNTESNGSGTFYEEGAIFTMPDEDMILYAVWELPFVPYLGDSGGYVFYDKGNNSGGWRYLEAAPLDIVVGSNYDHIFGYHRTSPTGENINVGTLATIGSGKSNTQALADAMGTTAYVSRDVSITDTTDTYAAKLCAEYDGGGHTDWFLPSKAELNQMYQNLKLAGLGDFSENEYWSSSENKYYGVWSQSFSDGYVTHSKTKVNEAIRVRPIRAYK